MEKKNALGTLPEAVRTMPTRVKVIAGGGLVLALGLAVLAGVTAGTTENYQYAFTNLTAEDSTEAAGVLKGAGIPFRVEAGGTALAVPAAKVYDARLLLAGAGIPRGGGVGFELFDRGEIGVTEFTQKVNLRRAIEGELSRTIGRLAEVRSARVHVTLPERSLFRDDERKPTAAVVVALQPGRTLNERSIAGIRHLVSSAVPGMRADGVTVVDGHGTVLSPTGEVGQGATDYQRKLEQDLEQRVVSLLEPVVGRGSVVARVTATMDVSEVRTNAEVFDPESSSVRSERSVVSNATQESGSSLKGVAGAAANTPLTPETAQATTAPTNRNNTSATEQTRNFELTKTTTQTVMSVPRLTRLSLAVLLSGVNGQPRPETEVTRLGELAKRAVGFDAERGDQMDISSAVFEKVESDTGEPNPAPVVPAWKQNLPWAAGGGVVLLLLVVGAVLFLRRGGPPAGSTEASRSLPMPALRPGATVEEIESQVANVLTSAAPAKFADPAAAAREKARELVAADPNRAVLLLRAWLAEDAQVTEVRRGG